MKQKRTPYQEALGYLFSLQKFGIKFGLSQTSNLLEAFGNPHEKKNFIHIAGTNGKGSVAAMLASILREAGLKVGFYSSPHLVRFTERFRINGAEMPQEEAASLIEEVRKAVASDQPPTFFEFTTAMALVYFAREAVDAAIMEVGMGGRLDATNVIRPLVSVVTNVSLEHRDYLGPRLLDIAGEKAGIVKEGVDVLTGATQPPVVELLQKVCSEKHAPLWRVGKDVRYRRSQKGLTYYGIKQRIEGLELGLAGSFQDRNAAMAVAAVEILKEKGFEVSSQDIRSGLKQVSWPGRMQVVSSNPTIVLDGAHNPGAMRALAHAVRSGFRYRRLFLVIGIMADKEIPKILQQIVPYTDYVIYTRPLYPRAADPERLMAAGSVFGKEGESSPVLTAALDRAKELAGPEDLVVVCGSLFTVGEAMTYFNPASYRPDDL